MSGITGINHNMGSGLAPTTPTVNVFTANGTWTKPAGCTTVYIECIGGGGGGGGGRGGDNTSGDNGGGGGGGAMARGIFAADSLESTLSVYVGVAAAGGAGGDSSNGVNGTACNYSEARNPSSGETILIAY